MTTSKPIPGVNIIDGSQVKVNPADFADTTFQAYAEKLSDDYTYILKKMVLPTITQIADIKLREIRVLATVEFFHHPLTPIDVSEILRYDPATVSRAVNKLVANGLMIRSKNIHDTRSFYLSLTDEGIEIAQVYSQRIKEVFSELESSLLYGLTDEEKISYLTIMVKLSKRSRALREICDGQRVRRY